MGIKITRLEAENIKRIKAVTIEPTANGLTVVGGQQPAEIHVTPEPADRAGQWFYR